MKKPTHLLLHALGAGCLAALYSCSNETDLPKLTDDNNRVYLKVAIQDVNSATRVDNNDTNFESGTTAENAIGSLRFYFYDSNGQRVDKNVVQDLQFADATTGNPSVGQESINVAVVQVSLTDGSNLPSYVVVSANPIDYSSEDQWTDMYDLRNLTRTDYKDAAGKFTMTNSAYYGADPVSGSNAEVKMTGAPILASQLFTTQEEAINATGGSIVDIYLERLAAKVNFDIKDGNGTIQDYPMGDYTLTFIPEAWGISADAPSMYAIKRFSADNTANSPIPNKQEVQNYIGTGWTLWNDPTLFRSYWACSPGFYATAFPQTSDNIMDAAKKNWEEEQKKDENGDESETTTEPGTGAGEIVAPYSLKYYSYNQLKGEHGTLIPVKSETVTTTETTRYALENTMGKAAFASLNPEAAAPSAILVGKYKIKTGGNSLPDNTSFAIWNNKLYFIGNIPTEAAEGATTIVSAMLDNQKILAVDNKGTLLNSTNISSLASDITIEAVHPAANIRGTQALDENFVTLQLKSAGTGKLYYKPVGSSSFTEVTQEALDNINKQLADNLNYAKQYTGGAAYFNIPIKHLRATEDTSNSPFSTASDGRMVVDWKKVRVGDFGLVRNHVYKIKVNGIKGLGDGILNHDAPIVTPMETYNYYVRYTIRILNWRIVPTQGVIL